MPSSQDDLKFLIGPGQLGELIRQHDWSRTPLGPITQWQQSLKTAVSLMLSSRQPMWIGWGPQSTFLYNDAYIGVLGAAKHPWALGRPAQEVWSEIWHICGPLSDIVFKQGDATVADDVRLLMNRGSFLEETFYSFSYSPIRDESGNVAGLFCPNLDVTAQHLTARRLKTLSELATGSLVQDTVDAALASAMEQLSHNRLDIPFAAIYLDDAATGAAPRRHAFGVDCLADPLPPAVSADATPPAPWEAIAEVLRTGAACTLAAPLAASHVAPATAGITSRSTTELMILPLTQPGQESADGALVMGVSGVRRLDTDYRSFFNLVAAQITSAIGNARRAEDEQKRVKMLAELDQAKTSFFSNISHEFRTPLTLMLGPLNDALADPDHHLPGAQRERIDLAQRNAVRLQRLVNSLLEFSRIQAGRVEARFEQTDLAALTADLASGFRSTIEHAGLRFDVDCPPLQKSYFVDPQMWEKIVLNLLSNAFKFTLEGGIKVTLAETDSHAVLAVRDTGVGIPENAKARLFERFYRVEGSAGRTYEGSGIGLALVHDLVGLQGGQIAVNSTVGQGTVFSVAIPAGAAHLQPAQRDALPQKAPARVSADAALPYIAEADGWTVQPATTFAPVPLSNATTSRAHAGTDTSAVAPTGQAPSLTTDTVLVVDDNADMRAYLQRILQARWQVQTVAHGQAALDAIAVGKPGLIVSDVMMPVMNGLELLARIRGDGQTRDIPFVLLSARAGEEARVEGLEAGADEYMVKPFSEREILARIDSLLLRQRVRAIETAYAQRLTTVFEQAPVAIAITRGPDHVVELSNPKHQMLVGHREIVGLPLRVAIPELDGQHVLKLLDEVYRTGVPHVDHALRSELLRVPGGVPEESFFNLVQQPLLGPDLRPEGIAVVCFEVTELVHAQRKAEQASSVKDDFLAMLGHELRNPLAPIITALQLMRLRGVSVAEKEREIIERQARHLVSLVDDLLDVARITQGKIQLRRNRIEIAEVVAKAIETASPLFEEKQHRMTVDVPATGLPVHADAQRLGQVLANLLTNAAKYTEPGGVIALVARRAGDAVEVAVTDNGIGIDAEMLPLVFEKFVQEQQALSRSRGGLGLGLAIAKSLTQLHGGTLTAASDGIGTGSTFTLRIPCLAPASDSAPAARSGATPALSSAATGAGAGETSVRSVLIVDDNADAAQMLSDMLSMHGYRTCVAHDAPSALDAVRDFTPDVALLDIGLPGMDGYELGTELRQRPGCAQVRLFAITGYGQKTDRLRSQQHGFDEHLVKPIDLHALTELLAAIVVPSEAGGH